MSACLSSILPVRSATRCCCLVLDLPYSLLPSLQLLNGTNLSCTNNRVKTPRSCHCLQRPRGMSTATLGLPSFELQRLKVSYDLRDSTRELCDCFHIKRSRSLLIFLLVGIYGMQVCVDDNLLDRSVTSRRSLIRDLSQTGFRGKRRFRCGKGRRVRVRDLKYILDSHLARKPTIEVRNPRSCFLLQHTVLRGKKEIKQSIIDSTDVTDKPQTGRFAHAWRIPEKGRTA